MIRSQYHYIQDFIQIKDDYVFELPHRYSKEWFLKHFSLSDLDFNEKEFQWLQDEIEKERIIIFGNQIDKDGDSIEVASLIFTSDIDRPEIFMDVPGIIIDTRFKFNCGLRYTGAYSQHGNCFCWLTFNCNPIFDLACKWSCDFIIWSTKSYRLL